MSVSTELAAILLAADRLESAGRLGYLLDTFQKDPILTAATNDKRHRATASKPGKVITRNDRQRTVGAVEREAAKLDTPVKAPDNGDLGYGFKADGTPRKSADPVWLRKGASKPAKPVKPVSKPVAKPATRKASAKNWNGVTMLSGAGTSTKNQREWLVNNAGMTMAVASKLSMVAASNLRHAAK